MSDPAFMFLARKQVAIEALACGRLIDALHILQQLLQGPTPIQRGVCRMCGCSEARPCGVLVMDEPFAWAEPEPRVERCSWADAEATVCTNVSCLERWRREAPAEMDVDIYDATAAASPTSRIVLP